MAKFAIDLIKPVEYRNAQGYPRSRLVTPVIYSKSTGSLHVAYVRIMPVLNKAKVRPLVFR
jgi:hypothetical protein